MKNLMTSCGKSLSCALLTLGFALISVIASAQNFTSTAAGSWTTGSNWGGTAPPTTGQSWGTINMNHNMSISGNYSFSGQSLIIAASKTLTISGSATFDNYGTNTISGNITIGSTLSITNGTTTISSGSTVTATSDFSISSGAKINISGTLNIHGDATLDANFNILPGGIVTIDGDVTVKNSSYLKVGTNANPTPYADLIIKKDLISSSSGDISVEKNGRVAVFGNYRTDGSGGGQLAIKNGGQIYIDKNVSLGPSANDDITNSNPALPSVVGLYINGTISGATGSSSVSAKRGDKALMQTNDPDFYNWVSGLSDSPLPITLSSFKIGGVDNHSVALLWTTAWEKNFDKFIIERSADAETFEVIGEVKGAGNSNKVLTYGYTDTNPVIGTNYYRLKAVDFDGAFENSKIIYTDFEGAKSFTVFPNPSNGQTINFKANFQPQTGDHLIIIDHLGVQVVTVAIQDAEGNLAFVTPLKSGSYIIKYVSGHYNKVDRLVVE